MALVQVLPGSGSQRNVERGGFRLAYTKVMVTQPVQPTDRYLHVDACNNPCWTSGEVRRRIENKDVKAVESHLYSV